MQYTMLKPGSTIGAKSRAFHRFEKDDVIEAPKGEFDHLPSSDYQTTMIKPEDRRPASDDEGGEGKTPKKSTDLTPVSKALAYIEDHPDLDVAAFIEGDKRKTLVEGIPGERISPATGGK